MADISMNVFSKMLGRSVPVKVIIPFDVADQFGFQEPYKTLYFLPGHSANAESIVNSTILPAEVLYRGFAVVIPDGENSFYMDQPATNAYYEKFVAEELVQMTRKLFPLSNKREDTYIGGVSMGGFGSLMLGSRHMDVFGKIMALSPATDVYNEHMFKIGFSREWMDRLFVSEENFRKNYDPLTVLSQAKEAGKDLPDIFMCCGAQDPLTYMLDCEFVKKATDAGIPITYLEGDGSHETRYWNRLIPDGLDFILNN